MSSFCEDPNEGVSPGDFTTRLCETRGRYMVRWQDRTQADLDKIDAEYTLREPPPKWWALPGVARLLLVNKLNGTSEGG